MFKLKFLAKTETFALSLFFSEVMIKIQPVILHIESFYRYQKQNITRIMGQDFQLKSLDGINWQPFPDVKPIGKKSNKVYKQKKKQNTPATQTL